MRDLLRHRAEQGARCPSIFTITKTRLSRYELRLYCEQPDGPHPLPDDAGRYRLTNIPDWLHTYAPYLRMLLTGLRYALSIVGPVISGVAGYALAEADKARLDLSCKLLDDLKDLTHDRPGLPRDTADFTELRKALLAIDPEAEWGGLRERELPENRGIAYLCLQHREALRYPAWGER
jgi:internalin A